MAIPNKYKNILDNFIDSSNLESLDWPKPIDKRLFNASRSRGSSIGFLEENCLDENVLASNRLSRLVPKTGDF